MQCPYYTATLSWSVCLPLTASALGVSRTDGITADAAKPAPCGSHQAHGLLAWVRSTTRMCQVRLTQTAAIWLMCCLIEEDLLLTGHTHAREVVHEESDHVDNDDRQQRARVENHLQNTATPQHAHCKYRVTLLMDCVTLLW